MNKCITGLKGLECILKKTVISKKFFREGQLIKLLEFNVHTLTISIYFNSNFKLLSGLYLLSSANLSGMFHEHR